MQQQMSIAIWSSGNAFAFGAEGLRFKSRAGQIVRRQRSVADDSPPLPHFLGQDLCCLGPMTRRWALPTHHRLRRNRAIIIKDLILMRLTKTSIYFLLHLITILLIH